MAKQLGFSYDQSKCIRCLGCEVACKVANSVEPGVRWRKVTDVWSGEFPNVKRTYWSASCHHCEKPACVTSCKRGAITKRAEDGIVVIDQKKCNGCGDCAKACTYGAIQFGANKMAQKCDFCLSLGRPPACAIACPGDALDWGEIEELKARAAAKNRTVKMMEGPMKPSTVLPGPQPKK
jgi:anaerobic dimethyl sulfoxide reductase subunit B